MAAYTDEELLKIVGDERKRSIGFDHDAILKDDRERALRFMKGDMSKEVPSLPNRSSAVSTDINDAIETALPDLIEILVNDGEEVFRFEPRGPEDEELAEQETDYVRYVIQKSGGFVLGYTIIKDALSQKTGIAKYWWESDPAEDDQLEGVTAEAVNLARQSGELVQLEELPVEEGMEPLYNATIRKPPTGKVCIEAVAPEDFSVGLDTTIDLTKATYCAHRTRERAQDLIARGIDRTTVDALPNYSGSHDEMDRARDTAGEHEQAYGDGATSDLRQVEVVEHYIRLLDGDELKIYRVQTNSEQTVLIDKEVVSRFPFAAGSPYIVPHRFYGQSVADYLIELQKINTSLTRMGLDSGYFALNQRMEVATNKSNEFTIPDLLRNEPGSPIRSATGDAVRPIQAGQLGFDVFNALEYFQTKSEQRTGIVRNAQGLNPDTLHDTAKGAAMLIAASQKRMRLLARVLAETVFKPLYMGVHATIVEHAEEHKRGVIRLRGKWVQPDPTQWNERSDIEVDVGDGDEADLIALKLQGELLEKYIEMQGGQANGPFVTAENAYNYGKRYLTKTGAKSPELIISDPKDFKPGPPKPDPEMLKLQAQTQLQAADMQGKQQLAQMQIAADQQKAASDLEIQRETMAWDHRFKTEQAERDFTFQQQQATAELQLKREEMAMEANIKLETARMTAALAPSPSVDGPQMGGQPG